MKTELSEIDLIEIAKKSVAFLDEKKALETLIIDLKDVNSYLDYFIITSGNSHVHCRSLAKGLQKYMSSQGLKEKNKPALDSGWIILDYSEIIIHIFTLEMREYYQLEKLWGDASRIEA